MMFEIFNQTRKWQVKKTNILYVVVASLILTSVLIPSEIIKGTNAFTPIPQTVNNDGKIFDTLASDVSSNVTNEFRPLNSSSTTVHDIAIKEQVLPDGEPAYKMIKHIVNNSMDVTGNYSNLATIPGPAIVINDGDKVHVAIQHLDGNTTRELFVASHPGTFVYQDDELGDRGLYGVVIVNPKD